MAVGTTRWVSLPCEAEGKEVTVASLQALTAFQDRRSAPCHARLIPLQIENISARTA